MDRKQDKVDTSANNQAASTEEASTKKQVSDVPTSSTEQPNIVEENQQDESVVSAQHEHIEQHSASQDKSGKPRGGFLLSNQDDDEEIARMLRDIRNDREGTFPPAVRYLGYGLSFFTLIALGIMTIVMVRDVRFASQVYGPSKLLAGERATFRVAIFEAESTEFLRGVQGTFWLVDTKRQEQIFHGQTPQDVLIANLRIPRWPVGRYKLRVRVRGPKGEETLERPVELIAATRDQGRFAKENSQRLWQTAEPSTGPYRVRFFAEGRALVPDLNNYVYAWVQSRRPLAILPSPRATLPIPTVVKPKLASTSMPWKGPSSLPASRASSRATAPKAPSSRPTTLAVHASSSRPVTPPTPRAHSPKEPLRAVFGSPAASHKRRGLLNPFAEPPLRAEVRRSPPPRTEVWVSPNHRVWLELQEGSSRMGSFPAKEVAGIVRFPYMPQFFRVSWDVAVWGRLGKAEQSLQMKTEGYQMVADPRKVLLSPQGELVVRVDSLQRRAPLHIDLVKGGRRLWSTQRELREGRSEWKIKIPKDIRGLVTMQVYTEFYFPGEVYDARLFYVGQASEGKIREALRRHLLRRGDGMRILDVEEFPAAPKTSKGLEQWSRALFSLVKARFTPPSLLYDSSKDRLHSLRRYQHDFRRRTLMTLGGLGSCVLLGMFLWMFLGYRRDQQRMNDFAKEEDIHVKSRGLGMIFVAILVVAMIFASILYLFWAIQWKFDNM